MGASTVALSAGSAHGVLVPNAAAPAPPYSTASLDHRVVHAA
jgi:hypothetical protein